MITAFVFRDGSLNKSILSGTANLAIAESLPPVDNLPSHKQAVAEHAADLLSPEVVWVDLCNPTPSEIASIERAFGMEIPTREEMGEIEASSGNSSPSFFSLTRNPQSVRASPMRRLVTPVRPKRSMWPRCAESPTRCVPAKSWALSVSRGRANPFRRWRSWVCCRRTPVCRALFAFASATRSLMLW